MTTEERATGTPDHVYNAVRALSNILEAGAMYETYISDAEAGGRRRARRLFPRVPTGGPAPS